MEPDGAVGGRDPKRKAASTGFHWVSSSPSPEDVMRLEASFPEVVRIPELLLTEELSAWHQRAVIVRSFLRWVPVEAYIREFRRAGISGSIDPISLAHRCHIFRFEDPKACEVILNRPWVINGQIIGTQAWIPEFFPNESSVSEALVWMRLPNLPMEFWHEEILSAISESAGCFSGMDAATQGKNRGNYARVAVRVDLSLPLRPGTRVQGLQDPFWQPFVFESMEGVCMECASLHLSGVCAKKTPTEGDSDARGSAYGPWMVAVRQ